MITENEWGTTWIPEPKATTRKVTGFDFRVSLKGFQLWVYHEKPNGLDPQSSPVNFNDKIRYFNDVYPNEELEKYYKFCNMNVTSKYWGDLWFPFEELERTLRELKLERCGI